MAGEPQRGRVLKVLKAEAVGAKDEAASKQLNDDWEYNRSELQEPPYPPEQLVYLAETHQTHDSALQQKTQDVIGAGWTWDKIDDAASEDLHDELDAWFHSIGDDATKDCTTHETLNAAWDDLETIGWGAIEIARDVDHVVKHIYHVPAHTTRFRTDGVRIAQRRGNKTVWFKRWIPGDDRVVNAETGAIGEPGSFPEGSVGNEVLILKRASRRSSWYGIPSYISALGWIILSTAARDDNILFFQNAREARWAIVLSNLEDDDDLDEKLRSAFQVDLKDPHRNIIIPISGPGTITFQNMMDNGANRDMSFERLQSRADTAILIAHKMPPERLGLAKAGPLGGDIVMTTTEVYKEAVVSPSQELLAVRINRFIQAEYPEGPGIEGEPLPWRWQPDELDLTEEKSDVDTSATAFKANITRLNEARDKIGLGPLEDADGMPDPRGDLFFADIAGAMVAKSKTSRQLAEIDREMRDLFD